MLYLHKCSEVHRILLMKLIGLTNYKNLVLIKTSLLTDLASQVKNILIKVRINTLSK